MPDLIAIGEPLVEMAAESAGRLGDVDRFRCGWGGDTANFVLAAARLGGACGYVTRVGQDAFGRAFVAMLETHGVDASHVNTRRGTPHRPLFRHLFGGAETPVRLCASRLSGEPSRRNGYRSGLRGERARPAREWHLPGNLTTRAQTRSGWRWRSRGRPIPWSATMPTCARHSGTLRPCAAISRRPCRSPTSCS